MSTKYIVIAATVLVGTAMAEPAFENEVLRAARSAAPSAADVAPAPKPVVEAAPTTYSWERVIPTAKRLFSGLIPKLEQREVAPAPREVFAGKPAPKYTDFAATAKPDSPLKARIPEASKTAPIDEFVGPLLPKEEPFVGPPAPKKEEAKPVPDRIPPAEGTKPGDVKPAPKTEKPFTIPPVVPNPLDTIPKKPAPATIPPAKDSAEDEETQHVSIELDRESLKPLDLRSLIPNALKPEAAPAPREKAQPFVGPLLPEPFVGPVQPKVEVAPAPREVKPVPKVTDAPKPAPKVEEAPKPAPKVEVTPKPAPKAEDAPKAKPMIEAPKTETKPFVIPPVVPNPFDTLPKAAPKAEPKKEAAKDSLASITGKLTTEEQLEFIADLDTMEKSKADAIRERIAKLDPKLNRALLQGRSFALLNSDLFRNSVESVKATKEKDGSLTIVIQFKDGSSMKLVGIKARALEIATLLKDSKDGIVKNNAEAFALLDLFKVDGQIYVQDGLNGELAWQVGERRSEAARPKLGTGSSKGPSTHK